MFGKIMCLLALGLFGLGFAMGMTQHPLAFMVLMASCGIGVVGVVALPETPTMARCKAKRTEEMRAHIDS